MAMRLALLCVILISLLIQSVYSINTNTRSNFRRQESKLAQQNTAVVHASLDESASSLPLQVAKKTVQKVTQSKTTFGLVQKLLTQHNTPEELTKLRGAPDKNGVMALKQSSIRESPFEGSGGRVVTDGALLYNPDRSTASWLRSLANRVSPKIDLEQVRANCDWRTVEALVKQNFEGYKPFIADIYKREAKADFDALTEVKEWTEITSMVHDTNRGVGTRIKEAGWRPYNADDERYDRAFSKFFNGHAPRGVFFHNQEDSDAVYPRVESLQEEVSVLQQNLASESPELKHEVAALVKANVGWTQEKALKSLIGSRGVDRLLCPSNDVLGVRNLRAFFVSATLDHTSLQLLVALALDGTPAADYADMFAYEIPNFRDNIVVKQDPNTHKWYRGKRTVFHGVERPTQLNIFFPDAPIETVSGATITTAKLKKGILEALMKE